MTETLDQEIAALARELRALVAKADVLLKRFDGKQSLPGITPMQLKRIDIIVENVSRKYSITERQIYAWTRVQPIALARQICMVIVRAEIGLSTETIGAVFKRSQEAAMYAEKTVHNLIATDSKFAVEFAALKTQIETQLI